ncbi:unnamed protein product [Linum trigynum]|uniref:Uncharacterized protein n=1 Tax=Linum trigynum TaxID=586398 RepID=A0AAV2F7R2_9ROSI
MSHSSATSLWWIPWRRAISSKMSVYRSRRDENPMKFVSRQSTLWMRGSPAGGGGGGDGALRVDGGRVLEQVAALLLAVLSLSY